MTINIDVRRAAAVIIFAAISQPACEAQELTAANSLTTQAVAPAAAALTTVIVDGSSVYDAPRLFGAYRDSLGKPITRDNARGLVDALAALYTGDGFVKPEIRLDDSLAPRGVLRAKLAEPRISNVVFEGDAGNARDALERIATRLEAAQPLRQDDVPNALRDMRAIAGVSVTATSRRDPVAPNAYELVVKTDYAAVDGVVRMNNRGTDQAGPNFVLGQLFANGLLGHEEKLGLIFASATDPEEFLGGGLFVDAPLGDAGTRANALLFHSHSAPNETPVNLSDEYLRDRATLKFQRPLRQDSRLTLTLAGGLEADDLFIERDGTRIREDRLRVFETGLRGSWRGEFATQYAASVTVRKGLDALGAGLQARDLFFDDRRVDFLVTQLSGTALRRFADKWTVRVDGFAQYSNDVLPDSERFKIGGDRLGRGFEVAEIAGDQGLGAKFELRRELVNSDSFLGRISAYGFYDFGAAWKEDWPGRDSAATAGTGLAIAGAALSGYLEVAAPLTGPDIEGQRDASIFAELAYRF
ncbi:MAG TPA: ShlB/FhaC/HecB family hemolysin secretion/activation protein [Steroidobacteraceae bacterium]|nr:ShlB/FhaC/HecB family hemolysin secretion/activation protein [Steroidobacteraceae bacterium]